MGHFESSYKSNLCHLITQKYYTELSKREEALTRNAPFFMKENVSCVERPDRQKGSQSRIIIIFILASLASATSNYFIQL